MRPVAENPVFEWRYSRYLRNKSFPPPLDGPCVWWYAFARQALYIALKAMGAKPGHEILLPALICDVILAPINELGLQPVFYPLMPNLSVDMEKLHSYVTEKTVALLAVNYCGFPQDVFSLQVFCRNNRIWYIEDNVQGLLSTDGVRPLGAYGDFALFSVRKNLALPNGAALVVNNARFVPALSREARQCKEWELPAMYVIRNVFRMLQRQSHFSFKKRNGNLYINNGAISSAEQDITTYSGPIAGVTLRILQSLDTEHVISVRRSAFRFWLNYFKTQKIAHVQPIFDALPGGVVPFGFPFRGSGSQQLIESLRREGIEAYWWPDLPHQLQDRAVDKLAIIPTHALP